VRLHAGCAQGQGQGQRSRDTGILCLHENRFFSQANGRIATKLGCSGVGQSQAAWKLINIHILKL